MHCKEDMARSASRASRPNTAKRGGAKSECTGQANLTQGSKQILGYAPIRVESGLVQTSRSVKFKHDYGILEQMWAALRYTPDMSKQDLGILVLCP